MIKILPPERRNRIQNKKSLRLGLISEHVFLPGAHILVTLSLLRHFMDRWECEARGVLGSRQAGENFMMGIQKLL
jgi:hypothetical protein